MARLYPCDVSLEEFENPSEWPTAEALRLGLPEDWIVVHGCHWTMPTRRRLMQGEIDFVVISPAGAAVLVEQKNGDVTSAGGEFWKEYRGRSKSVSQQMSRNRDHFLRKLERARVPPPTGCISVAYFPDAEVTQLHDMALDDCCVVDRSDAERLCETIEQLIGGGDPVPDTVAAMVRFLGGVLELVPSLHGQRALAGQAQIRLSGPMHTVLENFEMQPMRLRIEACAGSGKSELLRVLARRALAESRRVLMVCFNRPLADLQREGLRGATVDTWFGLRRRLADALGLMPEFGEKADWVFWKELEEKITATVAEKGIPSDFVFDSIFVDEGQDLSDADLDGLYAMLQSDGDFVWVGDPEQDLMARSAERQRGHAIIKVLDNYRTPRRLAAELAEIAPVGVQFRSPVEGTGLDVIQALNIGTLLSKLEAEITRLRQLGLPQEELMIVGLEGTSGLKLLGDAVGPYALRRFTGRYTPAGEQVMTPGELLTESVARAKGRQCAHVLVLGGPATGMAQADWRRSLYVALTRATIGATLFLLQEEVSAR